MFDLPRKTKKLLGLRPRPSPFLGLCLPLPHRRAALLLSSGIMPFIVIEQPRYFWSRCCDGENEKAPSFFPSLVRFPPSVIIVLGRLCLFRPLRRRLLHFLSIVSRSCFTLRNKGRVLARVTRDIATRVAQGSGERWALGCVTPASSFNLGHNL